MNNPFLSIIVPVYNTKQYLGRCLDSILSQSFDDFELIIIDDCSTDGSKEISESYQKNDKRIKCIYNSKNKGQGLTRNEGIKLAQGVYIGFIDSDDYIGENMYREMVDSAMINNSDIVECNFDLKNDQYHRDLKEMPKFFDVKKNGVENYILNIYKNRLSGSVCNKIFRAEIIKSNSIFFKDNKEISSEDLLFNINLANHIRLITTINKPLYHYVSRPGSSVHSSDLYEWTKNEKMLEYFVSENSNNDSFYKSFFNFSLIMVPRASTDLTKHFFNEKKPVQACVNSLKTMRKNSNFLLAIKYNFFNKNSKFISKLFSLLFYLRSYYTLSFLYYLFLKLKKKKRYI